MNNPLIDAPFQPITTDQKSGIQKLSDKVQELDGLKDKEKNIIKIALQVLRTTIYDKVPYVPFICGEAGEKGQDGMPKYFFICPNYGLDGSAVYKKYKDYSAPEW